MLLLYSIGKDDEDWHDMAKVGIERVDPASTETVKFHLSKAGSAALTVDFVDASFEGAAIALSINGRRLLAYPAIGGDSRYDNCRGKPGTRPPRARIQANYVCGFWLKQGENACRHWPIADRAAHGSTS